MKTYDVIVIGAGVIGSTVAYQLARLGAKNVLVLDRGTIGAGTTSQSSGILRTHYSVKENVELAQKSWEVFKDFSAYLEDDEASCGLVKCGYMICAPDSDKLAPLRASLLQQQGDGLVFATLFDRTIYYGRSVGWEIWLEGVILNTAAWLLGDRR